MSRIAKNPIPVPSGVNVSLSQEAISVKGPKGELSLRTHPAVRVEQNGDVLSIAVVGQESQADAMAGTTRALVNNMVHGVSQGFERKLTIIGVGYRAQVQGKKLNLTLGFSHPVAHTIPEGITVETPTQTEIVVKGVDKQKVGQVAAEIRAYRPPEPYKGKGIRYSDEHVVRKQAKKK
ncbi:MAG TPA: 50S ribosomal protein L6 [Acidiferrobacteraceae bacterium]|nr:50S ribosomal protein L6 [Acidiferrobacteraceae bacterium]